MNAMCRLADAATERERSQREWTQLVREAVLEGNTLRAVGLIAGVSHARVAQIVKGANRDDC